MGSTGPTRIAHHDFTVRYGSDCFTVAGRTEVLMNEFLEVSSLSFNRRLQNNFGRSRRSRPILNNVSFTLADGDRVAILGRNGAGKTTLLRLLAGIFRPDAGTVRRSSPASALLDGGYGMVDALSARENCESRL